MKVKRKSSRALSIVKGVPEGILFEGKEENRCDTRTDKDFDIVSSVFNYTSQVDLEKKMEKYKKKIDSMKIDHENSLKQVSMLKVEIKEMKMKLEDAKDNIVKLIDSSKPKDKKVYEETIKNLKEHLGITDSDLQKKGIFGGLFK